MRLVRTALVALGLGLTALPAIAGGITFDLPRLDFPHPQPETTRNCTIQPVCTGLAR